MIFATHTHSGVGGLSDRFVMQLVGGRFRPKLFAETTDKIAAVIPQKGYPDLVTMEPTGRYALVTNRWADLVAVIDLKTHTQIRTIAVGKAPHGMALRPR